MVYKGWGDHLREHHLKDQAQIQYRAAMEWLYRCMEFAASARLGEDTSVAQAVLADLHLELGEADQAWTMAHAAREAAERAGNQLDLAEAILMLGKLHMATADKEEGRRFLEDAVARFQQLGRMQQADSVRQQLRTLADRAETKPRAA